SPEPPPMLVIASYRSEDAETSPMVRLLPRPGRSGERLDVREIVVDGLLAQESRELAAALFGEGRAGAAELADAVARESKGHPYLVAELVRHVQRGASLAGGQVITLDQVIRAHVGELPAG